MAPSEPTSVHGVRLVLLAVACATILAGAWLWFGSSPLALGGDNESLTQPLLADAFRGLRGGSLPIRTAGRWGGSPLAGDAVAGVLYLPYYLGFWATPAPHDHALDLAVALHLVVLVVGTAWWLRGLGIGDGPALVGALVIATTPTLAFAARGWIQYWAALAWWPWLWGACARLVHRPRPGMALAAATALALPVYAGYAQFALYGGGVGLGWLVAAPGPARARRVALAITIAAGAMGLAAPPLGAALATASVSMRMGPDGPAALAALDVFRLPVSAWPEVVRATPIGAAPYRIAPAVVGLALLGAFQRRFAAVYLGLAALAVLGLAAGGLPFRLLHALPPFSWFAGPVKLFYVAVPLAGGLAALGLARLLGAPPLARRAALLALAVATATASPWLGIATLAAAALPTSALGAALLAGTVASSAAFLATTQALTAPHLVTAGAFTPLLREPPSAFGIDRDAGRWVALDGGPPLRQVGMNFGARWDVPSWSGVGPLVGWRQLAVMEHAEPSAAVALVDQIGATGVVVKAAAPLAATLGRAGFVPSPAHAGLQAFRRPDAAPPRFALVPEGRAVTAGDAIAAARAGRALDRRMVLIEHAPPVDGGDGDPQGALDVVDSDRDAAVLRVRVERPTWLVARDPFHPSWEASVDGTPTPLVPAAGFLQAVLVPAGEHRVELRYRERGLVRGAVVLAVILVGLPLLRRTRLRSD